MSQQRATKATLAQGLFAALALTAIALLGHALFLTMTRKVASFTADLYASPYIWVPGALPAHLEGTWLVTGFLASAVAGIHLALIGGAGMLLVCATALCLNLDWKGLLQGRAARPTPISKELLSPGRGRIRPLIITPAGRKIRGIAPTTRLRLTRAQLKYRRQPSTPIEHLEAALLEILYAHRVWPADPAGHHATTNLYDHSRDVAQRLRHHMRQNKAAVRLARAAGLAHDIGKLIAYQPRKGAPSKNCEWKIRDKQHDELSAFIVRSLPELQELEESDQQVLLTVLRYTHQDGNIPEQQSSELVLSLLRGLQYVDGLVTRDEAARVGQDVPREELVERIAADLEKIVPLCNVNGRRTGGQHAEGFTQPSIEYVAIFERSFRERLGKRLPTKYAQALGLALAPNRREGHPSLPYIRDALERRGLLISSYREITPRNAMFSVKSGGKTFDWMFLLDRDAMTAQFPDSIDFWNGWDYTLKVLRDRQPAEAPKDHRSDGVTEQAE